MVKPYAHGDASGAVNTIALTFDAKPLENMPEISDMGYELLSEEDVERQIASNGKEEKCVYGKEE